MLEQEKPRVLLLGSGVLQAYEGQAVMIMSQHSCAKSLA